jgi:nucleoside-diphosphate-sugar epimerase
MPKVHQEDGCDVYIFLNEHPPPHVHVYVGDGMISFWLEPVSVKEVRGKVKANERRKARRVVENNRERLLLAWAEIHGE